MLRYTYFFYDHSEILALGIDFIKKGNMHETTMVINGVLQQLFKLWIC